MLLADEDATQRFYLTPRARVLGMACGARLVTTAINQMHAGGGRYALCTLCVGVGQGIAAIVERI